MKNKIQMIGITAIVSSCMLLTYFSGSSSIKADETKESFSTEESSKIKESGESSESIEASSEEIKTVDEESAEEQVSLQEVMPLGNPIPGYTFPANSTNSNESHFESAEVDISQYDQSQIMDIASEADWKAAWKNPNIVVFNIVGDSAYGGNLVIGPSGGINYSFVAGASDYAGTNSTTPRKIVIEGNGKILDSRNVCYSPPATSGAWDITMQNLTIYSRNYYGPVSTYRLSSANSATSKQTFHNITNIGTQMLYAPSIDAVISGDVRNEFLESYTSPLTGLTHTTEYNVQPSLEISNIEFLAGSTYYANPINSGAVSVMRGGTMSVHPYATLNIDMNESYGTAGEAYAALEIETGGIDLQDNAKINIELGPRRTNTGAIQINDTNSYLKIGKQAEVNIKADGHTGSTNGSGRNIIHLANGAKLQVGEEGVLNISSLNTGTSTSSVIYSGSSAEFTVARKGTFSVESDGTGSKSLIYMGATAKFRFSDAESVDMKFLGTPAAASSLVEMYGSAGKFEVDVQRVKQWNRGNLSETPDKDWSPMFGMTLPYNGRTVTNNSIIARSTTAAARTDFISYFNTGAAKTNSGLSVPGAQRVKFEYIPDVTVTIESISNDLITDVGSNVVHGITNPDAYVRITYTPPSGGQPITINQTVASPVEATPGDPLDEQTLPFTVRATGSQGSDAATYTYTLPDGQRFEAGGIINVYSFKEGKSDRATQVVLDKTPPTGDPVEYHTAVGETPPTSDKFVKNPADTNPVTPNFRYAFAEENSAADIAAMMNTQGEYDVYVYLLDNAVDSAGLAAPNKTKIKSKLIVHETLDFIEADHIAGKASEINSLTEAQLKEWILTASNANASTIIDGIPADLSEKIKVTDLGGLTPATEKGTFNVTLTVSKSDSGLSHDLTKVIQVFIHDDVISKDKTYALSGSDFSVASKDYPTSAEDILAMIRTEGALKLTKILPPPATDMAVTDIDIDVSELPAPRVSGSVVPAGTYDVPISYGTGDSRVEKTIVVTITQSEATLRVRFVDENDQDIVPYLDIDVMSGQLYNLAGDTDVAAKITAAQEKNYTLSTRPNNEAAYEITGNPTEAKYQFTGKLAITSRPALLDFKTKNVEGSMIRENAPIVSDPLKIADTRAGTDKKWTLKVALSEPLTSQDGTVVIPDAIRYKRSADSDEFKLNDSAQVMASTNNSTEKSYDISSTWGNTAESPGFKLEIPTVKVGQLGKYTAEITYTLSDAYEP